MYELFFIYRKKVLRSKLHRRWKKNKKVYAKDETVNIYDTEENKVLEIHRREKYEKNL